MLPAKPAQNQQCEFCNETKGEYKLNTLTKHFPKTLKDWAESSSASLFTII